MLWEQYTKAPRLIPMLEEQDVIQPPTEDPFDLVLEALARANEEYNPHPSLDPDSDSDSDSDSSSDDSSDSDEDDTHPDPRNTSGDAEEGDEMDTDSSSERSSSDSEDSEFPRLDLDYTRLKQVATSRFRRAHGKCIQILAQHQSEDYDIEMLLFQDGWRCVARFHRFKQPLERYESELATMKYVKQHTSIPVPETYFTNFDLDNAVGAPFELREHLPGVALSDSIWDEFTLDHKKAVISQIADVVAELSNLKFDTVGCMKKDGTMGPLMEAYLAGPASDPSSQFLTTRIKSQFANTRDYLISFIPDPRTCTEKMNRVNDVFREELLQKLEDNEEHPALCAPYRLIAGLDGGNMLFTRDDPLQPPKLSGIMDWDYSHSGLLYSLLEYPRFIQDMDSRPKRFANNKILRKHFVRSLAGKFPEGSTERREVRETFRMKTWALQNFESMWASEERPVDECLGDAYRVQDGEAKPYTGIDEWQPDTDSEDEGDQSDEEESDEEMSDDEESDEGTSDSED